MAKVQIKSEKLTPFGGFFSIMEQFDALLAQTIDSTLGLRCTIHRNTNHVSRHSFATRCIESNCDYKTVSVLLGHANITTTLNLYVHPNMEQKKKCITKMFKSLGK